MNQHTIRGTYSFSGKGLHTGCASQITLLPAPADYGIVFQRIDMGENCFVKADISNVSDARRSTTISCNGVEVHTVEHLLSALYALNVDNVLIQIDAPELPILDGSAELFARAILEDGLMQQKSARKTLELKKAFEYHNHETGSWVRIEPSEESSFELSIDFNSVVLGVQHAEFNKNVNFVSEIAPSRTFCFLSEIKALLDSGLIKGGDLENALVIDEPKGYYGGKPLRFPNECARHKLLDLIGDFALLGRALKARVIAYKPGHYTNTQAVRSLIGEISNE